MPKNETWGWKTIGVDKVVKASKGWVSALHQPYVRRALAPPQSFHLVDRGRAQTIGERVALERFASPKVTKDLQRCPKLYKDFQESPMIFFGQLPDPTAVRAQP